jgi:hypothetical protein
MVPQGVPGFQSEAAGRRHVRAGLAAAVEKRAMPVHNEAGCGLSRTGPAIFCSGLLAQRA